MEKTIEKINEVSTVRREWEFTGVVNEGDYEFEVENGEFEIKEIPLGEDIFQGEFLEDVPATEDNRSLLILKEGIFRIKKATNIIIAGAEVIGVGENPKIEVVVQHYGAISYMTISNMVVHHGTVAETCHLIGDKYLFFQYAEIQCQMPKKFDDDNFKPIDMPVYEYRPGETVDEVADFLRKVGCAESHVRKYEMEIDSQYGYCNGGCIEVSDIIEKYVTPIETEDIEDEDIEDEDIEDEDIEDEDIEDEDEEA